MKKQDKLEAPWIWKETNSLILNHLREAQLRYVQKYNKNSLAIAKDIDKIIEKIKHD